MDNIKVLKLKTGEEIVSDIKDEGSYYVLKNPVKFSLVQLQNGQVGVEMHQFMMLSQETEFELPKDCVMVVANPVEDIVQSYSSQFSDLVLPPEKHIVT
jgi:hypothetical protein